MKKFENPIIDINVFSSENIVTSSAYKTAEEHARAESTALKGVDSGKMFIITF